jgi:hypothetical protein
MKAKDKTRLMPHLKAINAVLENYASDILIDEASKKRVLQLFKPINF